MAINLTSRITEEERLLLRRAEELYARAENGAPALSYFLNPSER